MRSWSGLGLHSGLDEVLVWTWSSAAASTGYKRHSTLKDFTAGQKLVLPVTVCRTDIDHRGQRGEIIQHSQRSDEALCAEKTFAIVTFGSVQQIKAV